jgi:hypothetical protein
MTIEARSIATLRSLPLEQQIEVLNFTQFIQQRLTPVTQLRPMGLCRGEFVVPDNFDAPLPEEIL